MRTNNRRTLDEYVAIMKELNRLTDLHQKREFENKDRILQLIETWKRDCTEDFFIDLVKQDPGSRL